MVRVPREQRDSIMMTLRRWRKARDRVLDHMGVSENAKADNDKEQRLDRVMNRHKDALFKKVVRLPFAVIDNENDPLAALMVYAVVGNIANYGYDRDSLFDWAEELADNILDEEEGDDGE